MKTAAELPDEHRASPPKGQALAKWLDEWVALGDAATRGLPANLTATEILADDRGRLDKR